MVHGVLGCSSVYNCKCTTSQHFHRYNGLRGLVKLRRCSIYSLVRAHSEAKGITENIDALLVADRSFWGRVQRRHFVTDFETRRVF